MGLFSELQVKITASIAGAQKAFRELNADLAKMSADASRSSIGFQKLGQTMTSIGTQATLGLSAPIVGVGAAALKAAASMEQAEVAFTTMLKSSSAARQQMEALKVFAASTPFQFPELVDASRKMQALGFTAQETIPTLRTIGNASSALGLGAEGMQRIILALGQIRAKGTAQAEEMRQLAEAGIPAWDALAKKIGVSVPEAMKLVEQRAVDSSTAIAAVMEAMDSRFAGGMEAQAKTLAGIWSNLKDQINFALADIGSTLAPSAKAFLVDFAQPVLGGLRELAAGFAALPQSVQTAVIGVTGLTVAAGPLLLVLGQIAQSVAMVTLAWVPLKAALTAVGGIVLSLSTATLTQLVPGLQAATLSTGALAASMAALTVGVGLAIYKIYEVIDAYRAWQAAKGDLASAEAGESAARERLLKHLKEQGVNLTALEAAWRAGALSAKQFDQVLRDAGLSLGESKTKAAQLDQVLENLGAKTTKQLAADLKKAKDELVLVNQAYAAGAVSADALLKAKEKVRSINELLHPSLKKTGDELSRLNGQMQGPISLSERLSEIWGERLRESGEAYLKTLADAIARTGEFAKKIETIPSKISVTLDIDWEGMREDVFADVADEQNKRRAAEGLDNMRKQSKVWLGEWKQQTAQASKAMQQVSLVVNDVSRDIARLIINGGKLRDVFVGAAKSIGEALIRNVLEAALKPILKSVTDLLGKLPGLSSIFGSSASSSLPGSVQMLNPMYGGGGGGGTGAAASGLTGMIGMATGIATAVSSVIGNFQMYAMNKSLDLIEWNTRKASIHAEHILTSGVNQYLAWLPSIHERLVELRQFGIGVNGNQLAAVGAGITVNFSGMVYGGPSGIAAFTDLLVAELRRRGLRI